MTYDLLLEWLSDHYLWLKAFHILAVIAWMAGLLYLPRLFVYHHRFATSDPAYQTFVTMEARLLRLIMLPSMVASFVFGFALILIVWDISGGWLHMKLLLVFGLAGFQGYLSRQAKAFARGEPPLSERAFRMINEIPAVIAIAVVLLVVLKPF